MRWRRYFIRPAPGGYVVRSRGCFATMLYWWLFALFLVATIVVTIKFWFIWVPFWVLIALALRHAKKERLKKTPKPPTCPRV